MPGDGVVLTSYMRQEQRVGHVRENTREGFIEFKINGLEDVVLGSWPFYFFNGWIEHLIVFLS